MLRLDMRNLILKLSKKARDNRAKFFREQFKLDESTTIFDIGSEGGDNIHRVLQGTNVLPRNVFIGDIDSTAIKNGHDRYGYVPVLLAESEKLPFQDKSFDIIYCSSVIEHVTIPKSEVWTSQSSHFRARAWQRQKNFAAEIMRVARQYFVQTPNKNFIIESHTWLPFLGFLPRNLLLKVMKVSNIFWIKQSIPDFQLLDEVEMRRLFPDAEIFVERTAGLKKSLIAIRKTR